MPFIANSQGTVLAESPEDCRIIEKQEECGPWREKTWGVFGSGNHAQGDRGQPRTVSEPQFPHPGKPEGGSHGRPEKVRRVVVCFPRSVQAQRSLSVISY